MENKKFPINTQLKDDNGQDITFLNEIDIEKWLSTQTKSKIYGYDYALIAHAPFVYTPYIKEALERYNLQKNYGVISYSNIYENIPNKWIETLSVIDNELSIAMKENRKNGGN